MRRRQRSLLIVLTALYGLAMLLMPMAHRQLQLPAGPDLSEFALPDGTLPVLCATTIPGKPGQPSRATAGICEACLLTAAPGLIVAGLVVPPPPALVPERIGRSFEIHGVAQKYVTAARPRAPPALLA